MLAFDGHFVLFPLFHYGMRPFAERFSVRFRQVRGRMERMKQRFLSAKGPP